MSNLILSSISENQLDETLNYLTEEKELISENCVFCNKKRGEIQIGGFLPFKNKVGIYCDDPVCRVRAYHEIMKRNGYGSPEYSE